MQPACKASIASVPRSLAALLIKSLNIFQPQNIAYWVVGVYSSSVCTRRVINIMKVMILIILLLLYYYHISTIMMYEIILIASAKDLLSKPN